MNSIFSRTLVLVAVVCALITAAQAAEVCLTDGQLIVAGVDDSIGLGAFDVVLTYGSDVSIISVEPLSGFLVAANIQNDKGMTVIAGISTEGLTGDVPVASVKIEGTGPVMISVRDLGNKRGDPIAFSNQEFWGTIPTSGSSGGSSVSGGVTSTLTQIPSTPTPTPVGTPPHVTETVTLPAVGVTPTATVTPEEESPTESQETFGGEAEAGSTPTAAPLSVTLVCFAVLVVTLLKRKG